MKEYRKKKGHNQQVTTNGADKLNRKKIKNKEFLKEYRKERTLRNCLQMKRNFKKTTKRFNL